MESDRNSARLRLILPTNNPIGEDLLVEILKRLPVKSLCRFRSICKLWKSLISSAFFINLHSSFTCSTTLPNLKPYIKYNLSFENLSPNSYTICHPRDLPQELHFPFRFRKTRSLHNSNSFTFVDVIHGVICFSYSLGYVHDSIVLWNPTIHKYVRLPSLSYPYFEKQRSTNLILKPVVYNRIGFGYDSRSNDFKVVRLWIPHCKGSSLPAKYEVYSVKECVWKGSIFDMNVKFKDGVNLRQSCFANGTIHWLVSDKWQSHAYSVLMFDCEREEFTTMELPSGGYLVPVPSPPNTRKCIKHFAELLEYGGMLSLLVNSYWSDVGRRVDLWVMEEEHGVTSSWKKLYRFQGGVEFGFGIAVYEPLLADLDPYGGPDKWIKFSCDHMLIHLLSSHVYDESMFLMDDKNARSYSKEEEITIII